MLSENEKINQPILIGPGNAVAATGAAWVYWRRHAKELGVEIFAAGSKRFIIAAHLVAALERRKPKPEVEHVDQLAEMRARVAGAR